MAYCFDVFRKQKRETVRPETNIVYDDRLMI